MAKVERQQHVNAMFADHQALISSYARQSPEHFRHAVVFVLATIRMPLRDAAADLPKAIRGEPCRSIFGAKHAGVAEITEHAAAYYGQCENAYLTLASDEAADAIVACLTHIPGIGFVKAGFIAQLVYGLSGCIDTHNCQRYGIDPATFHCRGPAAYRKAHINGMATDYNRLCERLGGTAQLWDTWCEYVAARGTAGTVDPEAVSALHLAIIGA